jgi:hypothetical protein
MGERAMMGMGLDGWLIVALVAIVLLVVFLECADAGGLGFEWTVSIKGKPHTLHLGRAANRRRRV